MIRCCCFATTTSRGSRPRASRSNRSATRMPTPASSRRTSACRICRSTRASPRGRISPVICRSRSRRARATDASLPIRLTEASGSLLSQRATPPLGAIPGRAPTMLSAMPRFRTVLTSRRYARLGLSSRTEEHARMRQGETAATATLPHRCFTADEYHRMGEAGILRDDDRVELIEGQIVEMAAIGDRHVSRVIELNAIFASRVGQRAWVSVQNPLRLSKQSEPQPDLVLMRRASDKGVTGAPHPEDVLLLIEVADTT